MLNLSYNARPAKSQQGIVIMIKPLNLSAIPQEDEAMRAPVREFLRTTMRDISPDIRARSWMGFDASFSQKLAQQGWLGLSLPKKYGGQEQGYFARFVIVEELLAAGAPVAAHWIADRQSGPLIAKFGSDSQKEFYLPRICKAQAFFCIGMSEPNAGSDLASVGTRAERTEGGWKLNGQKIWTTYAHNAHYMIALVRTSGTSADRHRGLSQIIVDLSLEGITIRPIEDLAGDGHFSEVFFDDVMLSEDALIGSEGSGWKQVTAELGFERSGPERLLSSLVLLEEWINHLCQTSCQSEASTVLLGRLISELATLREMSIALTALLSQGENPAVEAALVKDLGTTFEQEIPTLIADALAQNPDMYVSGPLLKTLAYVTQVAPTFSLRGGTREILRGMIARGLGLR